MSRDIGKFQGRSWSQPNSAGSLNRPRAIFSPDRRRRESRGPSVARFLQSTLFERLLNVALLVDTTASVLPYLKIQP